jgi:hypothetical protein
VAFVGMLGESSDKPVRQLEKIVAGNPVARVEFGKLQNVDTLGAEMLLKAMRTARKAKCELVMSGAEKLAELLKSRIEVGKREDEMLWMLLLELYSMAQQDPFEVGGAPSPSSVPPLENRPPKSGGDARRMRRSGGLPAGGRDVQRRLRCIPATD